MIPAGTSGTPASSAIRAAPLCADASYFLRSPFRRRVPSGNIAITCPSRASCTAVSIAARSARPRFTLNAPAPAMIAESGNQKSSDFAMKRRKRRGQSGEAERPGVEIRDVAGGEDVAAGDRQMLLSASAW